MTPMMRRDKSTRKIYGTQKQQHSTDQKFVEFFCKKFCSRKQLFHLKKITFSLQQLL